MCLLSKSSLISDFDATLHHCIDERKEVSITLKHLELSMLAFYEELLVFRDTQDKEERLVANVEKLSDILDDANQKVRLIFHLKFYFLQNLGPMLLGAYLLMTKNLTKNFYAQINFSFNF